MKEEHTSSRIDRFKPLTYLALGDSYTIGEGVKRNESFPYQLVAELQKHHLSFHSPTIIAQTGWTTRELMEGIAHAQVSDHSYDLVTLLIGVNNQYRGLKQDEFQQDFEKLLEMAIQFGGGCPERVIVLSIPDWGVTSFAEGIKISLKKITMEIDQFNKICQTVSEQKRVNYLDITEEYRKIGGSPENQVDDQLHPSRNIYRRWAKSLTKIIFSEMNFDLSDIPNFLHQDKEKK